MADRTLPTLISSRWTDVVTSPALEKFDATSVDMTPHDYATGLGGFRSAVKAAVPLGNVTPHGNVTSSQVPRR